MYDTFSQMLPFSVAMFNKNCKQKGLKNKDGTFIKNSLSVCGSNLSKKGQFVIAGIDRCHFLLLSYIFF